MNNNQNFNQLLNRLRKIKRDTGYQLLDIWRITSQQDKLAQIVNEQEVRMVGLRRSGNHAIINWIRKQCTGTIKHLNNIPINQNPYRFLYFHYPKAELQREAVGNFLKKDWLLYSYEDYSLEEINNSEIEKNHDLYLGKSAVRYDIVILRDPFNLMASRLKKNYITVKTPNTNVIDLWINHAKEFTGETNQLKNNKIVVNYNQWFMDIDYRRELTSQLKIDFTDAGVDQVKSYGGGSSFDGENLDGKATKMDVLNRYKMFREHPEYKKLLENEELLEYSYRIFGDIGMK
jgi:hypothetical protein